MYDSAWALGWAVALSAMSPLPLWFTLLVLFVFWPVFGLGANSAEPTEPVPPTREQRLSSLRIRMVQLAFVALVAVGVAWYFHIPYATAFAYSFLPLVASAAVNGALIDWEDNQPGGFLNPNPPESKP
jgi:hypothetical protein